MWKVWTPAIGRPRKDLAVGAGREGRDVLVGAVPRKALPPAPDHASAHEAICDTGAGHGLPRQPSAPSLQRRNDHGSGVAVMAQHVRRNQGHRVTALAAVSPRDSDQPFSSTVTHATRVRAPADPAAVAAAFAGNRVNAWWYARRGVITSPRKSAAKQLRGLSLESMTLRQPLNHHRPSCRCPGGPLRAPPRAVR